MNGYILESRTILNSDIWRKPSLYFKVWHFLLLKAQYSDYGNLKRGQLFTSLEEIREECSYFAGFRKVTPSKAQVYKVIEWLRNPYEGNAKGNNEGDTKEPMIVTTKVTHGMLVTICNYNVYQDFKHYEVNNGGNNESHMKETTKELRKERQGNNIKKTNKNNKEEEYCYSSTDQDEFQQRLKSWRKERGLPEEREVDALV